MPRQCVRAVDIFRIDRGHDERSDPHIECVVKFGLHACRLFWTSKPRSKGIGVYHQRHQARILLDGCDRRFEAGGRSAREGTLHFTHAALDARHRCAEPLLGLRLQECNAKIGRDGVKAARKDNAGA